MNNIIHTRMKNIFIKTLHFLSIGALALVTVFSVGAFSASAQVIINQHPNDCRTIAIANHTTQQGQAQDCWAGSISAQPGDIINVALYFHNSGTSPASNVVLRLSNPTGSNMSSYTFTGSVATASGSASVNFSQPSRLVFDSARIETQSSASLVVPNGQNLFSSTGLNIGTLNTGWTNQGVVKASFRVESTGGNNGGGSTDLPNVITNPANSVGQSSARLNGSVSTYNLQTSVWFEYGTTTAMSLTTSRINRGTASGSFDQMVTGLSSGRYYFRACGENVNGIFCGNRLEFTIPGNNNGGGTSEDLLVSTRSARNIDEDRATLEGSIDDTGGFTVIRRWFEWGTSSSNLNRTVTLSGSQTGTGTFSQSLSGLSSNTRYYFRACAENDNNETDCGSTFDFRTEDNSWSDNDDLAVETLSPQDIRETSATLRGEVRDDGNDSVRTWFEWGTSASNLSNTVSVSGNYRNGDRVTRNLSGLSNDRTYYYRFCGENSFGTDCGSVVNFRTNQEFNTRTQLPLVTTLSPIARDANFLSFNGYCNAFGDTATTWFEYGTSTNLGSRTPSATITNAEGMAYLLTGLNPNTTYYYRAVCQNSEGINYGATLATSTLNRVVVTQPPVVINTVTTTTTGTGGGSSLIRLAITNNQDTVFRGETVTYEVTWENLSGRTLNDLVLEVRIPQELRFIDTDRGRLDRRRNTVIIEIRELQTREIGEANITVAASSGLREGDPVVAQAIMAFENPINRAQENAIAYDADIYSLSSSVLGASVFGSGFLPGTLIGWLILLLIILAIILLVRYFYGRNRNHNYHTYYNNPAGATPVHNTVATDSSPNEYTPYRPTPRS